MPRKLIVNADDLGYTTGVTDGILAAFQRGIVTSASLMVDHPDAAVAARRAAEAGLTDLGLHLDFGEWIPRGDEWTALYEGCPLDDRDAVAAECRRQFALFREFVGREPSHVDSHQHVHRDEPLRAMALEMASEHGVPLRHFSPRISYCGGFYGQDGKGNELPGVLTFEGLLRVLRSAAGDVVELCCHPGWDDGLATTYGRERRREVNVLCDPRVPAAVAELGFEFATFAQTR